MAITVAPAPPDRSGTARWWALGALALSLLTIGLDSTVLAVALPTLASDLNASNSQLQWFTDSYNLVLAAALLPAGLAGDRYGRKKLLLVALSLFGAASVACAYAPSTAALIASRAVLGIGAALLMPLSMAMLSVLFAPAERPKALAIWTTATAIGIPLGPMVGGLLLNHFWWGSAFLLNVPLVIFGLIAVALLVPESRSATRPRIDGVGIALGAAGLAVLTYGAIEAGERGWTDTGSLVTMAIGAVLLGAFWAWERRTDSPVVDLKLFRSRAFAWGTALATVAQFAMFGLFFALPLYFQAVRGTDALGSGLRLLPLIGGLLVAARAVERLIARVGVAVALAIGFTLMAVGLGVATSIDLHTSYGLVAGCLVLIGMGMGFTFNAAIGSALGALSAERSGSGSAVVQAIRQVGGTLGVAILGTVLNSGYRGQLDGPAAALDSAQAGVRVAAERGSRPLLLSVRSAFVHGMSNMLWVCVAAAVVGIALALVCMPRSKS